jgi:hypothetical protein
MIGTAKSPACDRLGARSATLGALCFAGAAAVALARFWLAGTLRVDQAPLPLWQQLSLGLALGLCLLGAGLSHLRALAAPALPLRGLLAAALLLHLCAALALPLTSNDLFSNLAYGRLARAGFDPYLTGPDALPAADPFRALVGARWLETRSVYGPVVVLLDSLCAGGDSVAAAVVKLKAASLALSLLTVLAAWGLCRRRFSAEEAGPAFLFVACNPLCVWELSGQAHNDVLVVLALVCFAWAALEEREALAVLCLALGFYSKASVAPVLGLYLLLLLRRAPLRAVALGLAAGALGVLLLAPFWHGPATLAGPLEATVGSAGRHARSFADLLYWAAWPLGTRAQDAVMAACRLLGGALLAAFALRAALCVRTLVDVASGALGFFLLYDLIASPWFQPWYATWLLPLALLLGREARGLVAGYTVWTVVQYALPIDPVSTVAINLATLRRLGWRRLSEGIR